jgi:hypothetical protein
MGAGRAGGKVGNREAFTPPEVSSAPPLHAKGMPLPPPSPTSITLTRPRDRAPTDLSIDRQSRSLAVLVALCLCSLLAAGCVPPGTLDY